MDTANGSNTSDLTLCQDIRAYISDNNIDCSNATKYNKRSFELGTRGGMNILGIIVFTVAFAITLGRLGEEGRKVVNAIGVLNEAIMKLVTLVMWYVTPPPPLSLHPPSYVQYQILYYEAIPNNRIQLMSAFTTTKLTRKCIYMYNTVGS